MTGAGTIGLLPMPANKDAMQNAIITCAPTGAIHTPSMSPYLPVTPGAIAEAALAAADAGAAIIHLHVRDPRDGRPIQDVGLFREVIETIRGASDVVINVTTGGSPHMSLDERIRPAIELAPELVSLNMGTMNMGLFPMLNRFPDLKHEWERAHLGDKSLVFRNTYADIERILRSCAEQGTRFEFECYDTAHLYNLAHFIDRGLVARPFLIQAVMGLLGGIGSNVEDLLHLRRTARRLFGDDVEFSALGAGAAQIRLGTIALAMGDNARVGLEDSLWDGPGKLARSNRAQVERICAAAQALYRKAASPAEARQRLGLRGN